MGRLHQENAAPSQLRELALMGVKHERTGMLIGELEDGPLTLAEGYNVGPFKMLQIRACAIKPEEVAVEVKGVEQVELRHIDQVDAYQLPLLQVYRMLLVVECDGVDGIDLVFTVEVGIEAVHHHHQLLCRRAIRPWVDDERSVESFVNVALNRNRVAVIEMQPKGFGIEIIGVASARLHRLEGSVHVRRMDAVKMNAVRMAALVGEMHADTVALGAPDSWSGHLTVVSPGRIEDARGHFDLSIFRHQLVFPEHLS